MGYDTVTVRITGGQSVKIETTGKHIKLEANHRWVKCNYPKKKKKKKEEHGKERIKKN